MSRRLFGFFLAVAAAAGLLRNFRQFSAYSEDEPYQLESKSEIQLGTFQVTGDTLIVSDPSYDLETVERGNGAKLNKPLKGVWKAHTVIAHFRSPSYSLVADIVVHHESVEPAMLHWDGGTEFVGVDTGTIGIFDLTHFHDASVVPKGTKWTLGEEKNQPAVSEDLWLSLCTELTMPGAGGRGRLGVEGGVILGGAVTRSGMGDGAYYYFLSRSPHGDVVGVKVHFVDDDGTG